MKQRTWLKVRWFVCAAKFVEGGGGPGGHSQTEVVPMLVRAPHNWTLNGVIPDVKIYP